MGTQNERQPQTYRARPEPGQLVEVRRRQWVVADVEPLVMLEKTFICLLPKSDHGGAAVALALVDVES